jgi:hypothetical protein
MIRRGALVVGASFLLVACGTAAQASNASTTSLPAASGTVLPAAVSSPAQGSLGAESAPVPATVPTRHAATTVTRAPAVATKASEPPRMCPGGNVQPDGSCGGVPMVSPSPGASSTPSRCACTGVAIVPAQPETEPTP